MHAMFLCHCGSEFESVPYSVSSGNAKSCGCLSRKILQERNYKHGMASERGDNRLYRIWANMKTRCSNKNVSSYNDYGGRGISVCDEWSSSFPSFYEWSVNHGYADSLVIDRIDNDMGYSPENCRWITVAENNKNKRARKDNKVGISGVSRRDGGYRVRIKLNKKDVNIGQFSDFFEACCARKSAENRYWKTNGVN